MFTSRRCPIRPTTPVRSQRACATSALPSQGIDLDRSGMQKTIRDFLRDAARSQVAIVCYAGHGVQIDGRNYLVPVDVQFGGGHGMTDAMMDLDTIMVGLDDQV